MAFESLSDKLQNVFKNLRGKGRLTEADVKAALKEVKMALLEADVSFRVVKQFISAVQERAVGQDVMNSLTPGQMVIKIVNEELVNLMGSETTEIHLKPANEITIIMMAGLQGAGKTTTTAKIAGKLKAKGRKPLLAACDVYRPAAIKQLQINGEKQGVPVFSMGENHKPADIAKAAVEHASKNDQNVVILDTAGRLHIDEDMMAELIEIKEATDVFQTILVVDAMTGQDAVNVSGTFNDKIGIDGVKAELEENGFNQTCIDKFIALFADGTLTLDSVANVCDASYVTELQRIIDAVTTVSKGTIPVEFCPSLVRGQGYYTGTIFEVEAAGYSGAVAGGGRYDNLIGKFLNEDIPAVGFSIGFERIFGILMEQNYSIPNRKKKIAVFYDTDTYAEALIYAEDLRNDYIVSVIARPKKLGKYLNKLETQGFDGFAVYGQEDGVKLFGE